MMVRGHACRPVAYGIIAVGHELVWLVERVDGAGFGVVWRDPEMLWAGVWLADFDTALHEFEVACGRRV